MAAMVLLWLLPLVAGTRTSARTWRPSSPGFVFPEQDEFFVVFFGIQCLSYFLVNHVRNCLVKEQEWSEALAQHLGGKDFGIALAGGGTRGLALGHGILRSLRETGRSGSGKSWCASVWFTCVMLVLT